jgi:hypothetical protein
MSLRFKVSVAMVVCMLIIALIPVVVVSCAPASGDYSRQDLKGRIAVVEYDQAICYVYVGAGISCIEK